ncbi:MAG: DUF4192 domain-containing protein [Acidipropionibacterium sp.]|jgi:hypothetical protein|nr:DUF4192 domain-containing protein [Acidipropionibacterium sp.]
MPPVRIRSVDQAISIIPHLLGYQPDEDLLILIINPGLVCTVRADLDEVRTPSGFMTVLGPLAARFPGTEFLMVAWSREPREARGILAIAEALLGPERIVDAVSTDGRRWWSIYCQYSECAVEGHEVVLDEEVRAEAVYRGMGVLPDRRALAASVAGPTPDELATDNALLIETAQWAAALSRQDIADELGRIWDQIEHSEDTEEPLDLRTALRLAQLSCNEDVALAQWLNTTKEMARPLVGAWVKAISHLPDEMAATPLVLCGLAAWLAGDGALESCCLERASGLDPDLVIFQALDLLQRNAVHPSAWAEISPDPELISRGILVPREEFDGLDEPAGRRPRRTRRAAKRSRAGRRRRRR